MRTVLSCYEQGNLLTYPSVPPNVHFFIDDVEDDWNYSAPFDYIYARKLQGSIKNWPRFYQQAYE